MNFFRPKRVDQKKSPWSITKACTCDMTRGGADTGLRSKFLRLLGAVGWVFPFLDLENFRIIVCTCTPYVPYNVPYYRYNHRLVLFVRQIVDSMPIYGHFYTKIARYSSKMNQNHVKFVTFHSCTLFSITFQSLFNQNRVQLIGYKNLRVFYCWKMQTAIKFPSFLQKVPWVHQLKCRG